MKKKIFLLPNVLGEVPHHEVYLPASVDRAVEKLDGIIAESEKGGRRYLGRFAHAKKPHEIPLALLNEHTKEEDYDFLLEPILKGETWGIVSDAGLPCIADPGAKLIRRARELGIQPQAFVGPSSIFLALMLSGFSGQRFTFQGYLPAKEPTLSEVIRKMEKDSAWGTQIFIEAPYRNQKTLEKLLEILKPETQLAIAWDLTLSTQGILSQPVSLWKKSPLPAIDKKPAIFLIGL